MLTLLFNRFIPILFLALTFSFKAKAEYRVYQYYVASKLSQAQSKNSYLVTSTLDPVSYIAYHGGSQSIKVDLVKTWSCKGHTGSGKALCDDPTEKMIKEKKKMSDGPSDITSTRKEFQLLREKHQNILKNRQAELEKVNNYWDAEVNDKKSLGEKRLNEAHQLSLKKYDQAILERDQRLSEYQQQSERTKQLLAREKSQLESSQSQRLLDMETVHNEKALAKQSNSKEVLESIDTDVNSVIKEIEHDRDLKISQLQSDSNQRLNQISRENESKIRNEGHSYLRARHTKNVEQAKALAKIDSEHKIKQKDVIQLKEKELADRQNVYSTKIKGTEDQHQELMSQNTQNFEVRVKNLKANQNEILKRTQEKLDQEINALKIEKSKIYQAKMDKSDDQFYKTFKLEPNVVETPTQYEVSLKIPPYEEANVFLTGHDRTLKLNYTRRYDERVQEDNGNVFYTKRSEVLKKNWDVADIVDPKQLKRSYNDGTLTFIMKKA